MKNESQGTDLNLYYIKSNFRTIISKLCLQLYLKNITVLINLIDNNELNELDKFMWNYKKNLFLPHLTSNDIFFENNPIYLTTNEVEPSLIKRFDVIILAPKVDLNDFGKLNKKCFLFSYFKNDSICEKNKKSLSSLKYNVKTFIETPEFNWKEI